MYCTMYYFMLSCVVKTLFLKKEKNIKKNKQKNISFKLVSVANGLINSKKYLRISSEIPDML